MGTQREMGDKAPGLEREDKNRKDLNHHHYLAGMKKKKQMRQGSLLGQLPSSRRVQLQVDQFSSSLSSSPETVSCTNNAEHTGVGVTRKRKSTEEVTCSSSTSATLNIKKEVDDSDGCNNESMMTKKAKRTGTQPQQLDQGPGATNGPSSSIPEERSRESIPAKKKNRRPGESKDDVDAAAAAAQRVNQTQACVEFLSKLQASKELQEREEQKKLGHTLLQLCTKRLSPPPLPTAVSTIGSSSAIGTPSSPPGGSIRTNTSSPTSSQLRIPTPAYPNGIMGASSSVSSIGQSGGSAALMHAPFGMPPYQYSVATAPQFLYAAPGSMLGCYPYAVNAVPNFVPNSSDQTQAQSPNPLAWSIIQALGHRLMMLATKGQTGELDQREWQQLHQSVASLNQTVNILEQQKTIVTRNGNCSATVPTPAPRAPLSPKDWTLPSLVGNSTCSATTATSAASSSSPPSSPTLQASGSSSSSSSSSSASTYFSSFPATPINIINHRPSFGTKAQGRNSNKMPSTPIQPTPLSTKAETTNPTAVTSASTSSSSSASSSSSITVSLPSNVPILTPSLSFPSTQPATSSESSSVASAAPILPGLITISTNPSTQPLSSMAAVPVASVSSSASSTQSSSASSSSSSSSSSKRVCSRCGTLHSTVWRRGEGRARLCNACGLKYSRGKRKQEKGSPGSADAVDHRSDIYTLLN